MWSGKRGGSVFGHDSLSINPCSGARFYRTLSIFKKHPIASFIPAPTSTTRRKSGGGGAPTAVILVWFRFGATSVKPLKVYGRSDAVRCTLWEDVGEQGGISHDSTGAGSLDWSQNGRHQSTSRISPRAQHDCCFGRGESQQADTSLKDGFSASTTWIIACAAVEVSGFCKVEMSKLPSD
jgi:hypothetical protein